MIAVKEQFQGSGQSNCMMLWPWLWMSWCCTVLTASVCAWQCVKISRVLACSDNCSVFALKKPSKYLTYFLSLVSHRVIEEVNNIQENLEIEKTCRESVEALASKVRFYNKVMIVCFILLHLILLLSDLLDSVLFGSVRVDYVMIYLILFCVSWLCYDLFHYVLFWFTWFCSFLFDLNHSFNFLVFCFMWFSLVQFLLIPSVLFHLIFHCSVLIHLILFFCSVSFDSLL